MVFCCDAFEPLSPEEEAAVAAAAAAAGAGGGGGAKAALSMDESELMSKDSIKKGLLYPVPPVPPTNGASESDEILVSGKFVNFRTVTMHHTASRLR